MTSPDLSLLAPGLERREPGLWFARQQATVSLSRKWQCGVPCGRGQFTLVQASQPLHRQRGPACLGSKARCLISAAETATWQKH
jgi:hypothetical protein